MEQGMREKGDLPGTWLKYVPVLTYAEVKTLLLKAIEAQNEACCF